MHTINDITDHICGTTPFSEYKLLKEHFSGWFVTAPIQSHSKVAVSFSFSSLILYSTMACLYSWMIFRNINPVVYIGGRKTTSTLWVPALLYLLEFHSFQSFWIHGWQLSHFVNLKTASLHWFGSSHYIFIGKNEKVKQYKIEYKYADYVFICKCRCWLSTF
jgi:hypothetical protein